MNAQIRRLEEEISDLKATLTNRDSDLESALSRLRTVEEQYSAAQLENSKIRNEFEILQRDYDVMKVLSNLISEF